MRDFSDATLVLLGHGSTVNADSAAPTHQHADAYGRYTAALLLDVMVGKPSGFRGHW
jgi:hypothetical protein